MYAVKEDGRMWIGSDGLWRNAKMLLRLIAAVIANSKTAFRIVISTVPAASPRWPQSPAPSCFLFAL
jgi:hypothetical protein